MTPEQLAEIRARAEAATPGPWAVRGDGRMAFVQAPRTAPDAAYDIEVLGDDDTNYPTRAADLALIAHARTDIPALLDYIELLQTAKSYQFRSNMRALCHQMIDVMPDNDLPVQAIAERASFYERAYLQFVIEEPTNA